MPLKRNLIANYIGQGWTTLMGLAFIPLYIRYLGMESYGIIGLYAILSAWLQLANMGITPTLNREMARFSAGAHSPESIRDLLRSLETIAFALAILLGGLVWLASGWFAADWLRAERLPQDQVASAIAVMGLVVATKFVEGLYQGAILGLQKQVWYNVAQAVLATLRWAGAVAVLAWVSPTIQAYFFWQGAVSLVTLSVYMVAIYRWLPTPSRPAKFCVSAVRQIWRFAGGMMATTLLVLLLTQVDKMLLSKLLTLEHFGNYTLAAVVSGALYQVVSPITQAFYPRLTELHVRNDAIALAQTYHHGAQLVTVLAGAAALLLIIYAENILRLWTGDQALALAIAPLLALLAAGTFLNSLMHMPYMLQLAHGWSSLAARINLVAVSVLVPAIFWVVPRYGAMGAAALWVLLNAGYVSIGIHAMHRRLIPEEKWRWYGQDLALPVVIIGCWVLISSITMPLTLTRGAELAWIAASAIGGLFLGTLSATSLRHAVRRTWRAHMTSERV